MVKTKEASRDSRAKSLGLIDFSGDENLSPEIIDDALNSTSTFYENVGIAEIAERIKNNKAKHYGSSS